MATKSEQFILRNVNLAFPTLFEPRAVRENSLPQYSTTVVMDEESDTAAQLMDKISIAVRTWAKDSELSVEGLKWVKDPDILDGSGFRYQGKAGARRLGFSSTLRNEALLDLTKYPHYEGKLVFTASTGEKYPPVVVNASNEKIEANTSDAYKFHGGVLANVALRAYVYEQPRLGVKLALNAVQYVGEGERWSSGPSSPFEALTSDLSDLI